LSCVSSTSCSTDVVRGSFERAELGAEHEVLTIFSGEAFSGEIFGGEAFSGEIFGEEI